MKAFDGFKAEAAGNGKFEMLPAGPYVAEILDVRIDGKEPDQTMVLRLDVTEGEQAGYFTRRYQHESENGGKYEPRYKGVFRIRIPNDENTKAMYPESDKRKFNDAIFRIMRSNEGYKWDWNEQGLIGKTVGINMQAGEYNGAPYTSIGRLEIAEDVRKGLVHEMPPRKPRGDAYEAPAEQTDPQTGFTVVETEKLPF